MNKKTDYRELTKNIFSNKKENRKQEMLTKHHTRLANIPSLRKELLATGILCKDCHKYLAREHYSVCEKCYKKRIEKLAKSGGMRTLTPRLQKQLEKELQV